MADRKTTRSALTSIHWRRFSAGWRLIPDTLTDLDLTTTNQIIGSTPSILVDVIRPEDLVALTFIGHNLELITVDQFDPHAKANRTSGPYLQTIARSNGILVVQLAYQHLGERAFYEGLATDTDLMPVPNQLHPTEKPENDTSKGDATVRPSPPIDARPSRGSRIVLHIPLGEKIPFSTVGLLEAIKRFSMVVHPLARPRPGRVNIPTSGSEYHLTNGLVAMVGPDGPVISPADLTSATANFATSDGLSAMHMNLRRMREILASETGYAVELSDTYKRPKLITEGLVVAGPRITFRPKATFSRDAEPLETAIEAPYRLVVSPSERGGWAHATRPVGAENAPHHVELWHSRLGTRRDATTNAAGRVDERHDPRQRIVRAVWARDRERFLKWQTQNPQHENSPFRMSLDGADRHMLVRQSAETWVNSKNNELIPPSPIGVEKLWLSSLGGWLDLHGTWNTDPYSQSGMPSILDWDHVAPMGRDQYVRVAYPGYLFPFGHRATLVKLTERKMKDVSPSIAGLYQRKFLVVGEPRRHYSQRNLPFQEVELAPRVTPTLSPDPETAQDSFFFPFVNNKPFNFLLHCLDREGSKVRLQAPLMWVADHYDNSDKVKEAYLNNPPDANIWPYSQPAPNLVAANGQDIAFAPTRKSGDTAFPTTSLRFNGTAERGNSTPYIDEATVSIKVAEQLAPIGLQTIAYEESVYLKNGFGSPANAGEIWAKLTGSVPNLEFGGEKAPSDRAGGFITPNLPIAGLSRIKGAVSDIAGTASGQFNPTAFFAGAAPKLFGIVPLIELLSTVGVNLDDAPDAISETLNRVDSIICDLEQARVAVTDAVADTQQRLARAQSNALLLEAEDRQSLADELTADAKASLDAATKLKNDLIPAIKAVIDGIDSVPEGTEADVAAALNAPLTDLGSIATSMKTAALQLPPLSATCLRQLAAVLSQIATDTDVYQDIFLYVNGMATSAVEGRFRYHWRPRLTSWPAGAAPILEVPDRGLVLSVDGRVKGKSPPRVQVLAELRDFTLNLLPDKTLVRFQFDHISFKAGSSGKTEVDVRMNDIQFVGELGFIETLKELIPLDGFADPPFVDVDRTRAVAGFTLGLPNVAIGAFSLSNISLGADVQLPFLGDAVTVGFNFCTRERPFTLTVMAIGGGGWFGIRLSPDGLDVLELGLEAGACLSVNFGVASGSVSAMIGVYMRLEGEAGSLTGYLRLRGQVDVLGLISASIELYLNLRYEFASGKLIGGASISVKVEVFFLSFSVRIACERRFAGSNGDPTFAQIMGVQPDFNSPAWSDYCLAFTGE